MSYSLLGSSSSGSGGVEEKATNRLQHWQCGGIIHDMLMKQEGKLVRSIEKA